jgi:CBS domain-containing protein
MRAGEVMTTGAATIRPEASLIEAARVMIENRISGLPVVDARDRLVGIVTEGDFLRPDGGTPRVLTLLSSPSVADEMASRRVDEIMTREPITISAETPVELIVALINDHQINRLPVLEGGKVVGIVSRVNLLRALLRKAQAAPRES